MPPTDEALAAARTRNNEHLSTCRNCQSKVAILRKRFETDPVGYMKAMKGVIGAAFVMGLMLGVMMAMSVLWAAWRN